jgi:hypothetical protein
MCLLKGHLLGMQVTFIWAAQWRAKTVQNCWLLLAGLHNGH